MPQPKDKDWLNGYKNKTPTYVVYKRPTSKQGTHTYTLEFTTGEAGNYVLGPNPKGNWVFTDVSIFKATAQLGDVNGDTKVDVADITAMVNIIVANGYEKVADLDGDEDVDAEDVKALVNLVLGKE